MRLTPGSETGRYMCQRTPDAEVGRYMCQRTPDAEVGRYMRDIREGLLTFSGDRSKV